MTTTPAFSRTAALEHGAFRALLSALSMPGTITQLPEGRDDDGPWQGVLSVAQALLDHEVTFHVAADSGAGIEERILRRTGARTAPLDRAGYVFADATRAAEAVRDALEGPLEEPERSATVVLLCTLVGASAEDAAGADGADARLSLRLTGPGIQDEAVLDVAGLDAAVIRARGERNWPFPTGVDLVLVDPSGRVAGLPRSTTVELLSTSERDA